jgi:hypothetical protein
MSVDRVLSLSGRVEAIAVEGYLLLGSRGCTLMNCPETHSDCNTCVLEFRLSASPTSRERSIRLSRRDLDCLSIPMRDGRQLVSSDGRRPCSLDPKGQHVLVRASLEYSEMEYERLYLKEPEICELVR